MIKVKILNPDFDRNIPTFNPLIRVKDMLKDYPEAAISKK